MQNTKSKMSTWQPSWILGVAGFRKEPSPSEAQPTKKLQKQKCHLCCFSSQSSTVRGQRSNWIISQNLPVKFRKFTPTVTYLSRWSIIPIWSPTNPCPRPPLLWLWLQRKQSTGKHSVLPMPGSAQHSRKKEKKMCVFFKLHPDAFNPSQNAIIWLQMR
jgi:hypothetical protein